MTEQGKTTFSLLLDKINTRRDPPCLALQWKNTDACLDFDCECGASYHFDGYFCFQVQCPKCERIYALDTNIRLVRLSNEESELLGCLKIMDEDA